MKANVENYPCSYEALLSKRSVSEVRITGRFFVTPVAEPEDERLFQLLAGQIQASAVDGVGFGWSKSSE